MSIEEFFFQTIKGVEIASYAKEKKRQDVRYIAELFDIENFFKPFCFQSENKQ